MDYWHLDVAELAQILGVSKGSVYQWQVRTESGRPPDKNILKQLHYIHVIWKAWLQTESDLPPHIREYFEIARDRMEEAKSQSEVQPKD
jgi:hypothetical protein